MKIFVASVTTVFYSAIHQVQQGISFINEMNKTMTNIAMITGMTSEQTQELMKNYSELAGALHETTSSLSQASEEFLRSGNSIDDTNKLLQASTVMSKIAGQSQQESAQALISVMNSYKLSASDMIGVVDKMVAVDNTSATSTKELSEAIQKVASSAQNAGISLPELISYIGTISSVTRQSAKYKLAF